MKTVVEIGKCEICYEEQAKHLILEHNALSLKWTMVCNNCMQVKQTIKKMRAAWKGR